MTAEPSRVSLALTRKEYVDLLTDSAECNGRSFVKVFEDGIYVCSKEQECTGYHGVPGQPPPETIFLRKWMRPLYIHQGHEGGACIFEWQLHLSNIQIELGFESYKQQALDEDAIAPILELAWTKAFASWHNLQRVDLVRTWDEGGEYADSSRLSDIPGCRNLALSSYHQYSYGDLRLMRLFFLAMARSGAKLKELSLSADVTTLEELTVGADITPEPEPSPMLDNMRCTLAHLRYLQFAQEPLVENYQPWDPFVLELFGTIFEDCHSSLCGLEYRFSGYRDELKPVPLPSGLTFPCLRELSFESPPIGEHLCIDHVKLISNLVDNMPELRMLKLRRVRAHNAHATNLSIADRSNPWACFMVAIRNMTNRGLIILGEDLRSLKSALGYVKVWQCASFVVRLERACVVPSLPTPVELAPLFLLKTSPFGRVSEDIELQPQEVPGATAELISSELTHFLTSGGDWTITLRTAFGRLP